MAQLRRALDIPALSPGWQGSFRDLLAEAEPGDAAGSADVAADGLATAPAWAGFRPLRVTRIIAGNQHRVLDLLDRPLAEALCPRPGPAST